MEAADMRRSSQLGVDDSGVYGGEADGGVGMVGAGAEHGGVVWRECDSVEAVARACVDANDRRVEARDPVRVSLRELLEAERTGCEMEGGGIEGG